MNTKLPCVFFFFFFFFIFLFFVIQQAQSSEKTSIVFTTLGRSRYSFDIFSVPIQPSLASVSFHAEQQLTDGVSVNYNGFFPSDPSYLLSLLLDSSPPPLDEALPLVYVTERNGFFAIYFDLLHNTNISYSTRRVAIELPARLQFSLLPSPNDAASAPVSMKDRPTISREHLIYVSTHEPSLVPRQSWAAVYSTHLPTGRTRRLTPLGIADFSPSVSPSGLWTAVASFGGKGWTGEVQELNTSIYVFRTQDGSQRTLLVEHGGWPCWADDKTLYFHRHSSDGWWSVYRGIISTEESTLSVASVNRITPPGFHAFTPAASPGAPGLIAVATRRPSSEFRHIELVDLRGGSITYVEVTQPIFPNSHHLNPFISKDATRIGYHRCRGRGGNGSPPLLLENIASASPESLSLFRIDGSFPSFSPDGSRIAYAGFPGLYVMNSDGSGEPQEVLGDTCFATAWDWKRRGVIYTSHGPTFASESTRVDIVSVSLNDDEEDSEPSIKKLTTEGDNNAFPSPSPDGKWIVFRSGRSGHKNLYIIDAVEGETAGIRQLTKGPWSDTMCNWSPDGEWIAFASDRHNPGGGSFAIYLVHPNGTGLHRVVHSGHAGRTNHPWFSPDSKRLAFTSDYAGVSAEPIANPHHYQPYGDIFTVNIDGSDIRRFTHNSYEDGTPTWAPIFMKPMDVSESLQGAARCEFDDCHWLSSQAGVDNLLSGGSC